MTNSTHTNRYQLLLEILVAGRKAKKMSQAALAEELGRLQTFVSKYERGERRLDLVEFLDVTEALGLSPNKVIKQLNACDAE